MDIHSYETPESALELSSANRGAAHLLGDVIGAVDRYTGMHTRQVVELSVEVTQEMRLDATRRPRTNTSTAATPRSWRPSSEYCGVAGHRAGPRRLPWVGSPP
ncbi:MAG TPA: hypothetical protein VGH45_03840 [Solirubrobacteraceae bacterium]|jgi:hypothetical protein